MTKVSKEGRDALESLHTGDPVQVVAEAIGRPLIEAGYVNEAQLDPAPKNGKVAINITAKGRGVLAKPAPKVDTPPPAQ